MSSSTLNLSKTEDSRDEDKMEKTQKIVSIDEEFSELIRQPARDELHFRSLRPSTRPRLEDRKNDYSVSNKKFKLN